MRLVYTVCGSISAYKSYDIVRSLVNNGNQVKVILTKGALQFIKPQTFRYLGALEVYGHDDDFNFPKTAEDSNVLHIELARWCQKLIIAPASANTIANLSMGAANDLLSSVFLALEDHKPVLIFPAMNTQMLQHKLVQENMSVIERLKKVSQVKIMPTKKGELACGEMGAGKLLDTDEIVDLIEATKTKPKTNSKKLLIVTGATISPLDSVRYLTNPSSGLTGFHFAKQALARGHEVKVLAGKYATKKLDNLVAHESYQLERFTTTEQLKEIVAQQIDQYDAYLSPAAIGDIEFTFSEEKIKKSQFQESIPFKVGADILKAVVENYSHKFIVGFAAESHLTDKVLLEKWNSKPVNILVGTKVSNGLENAQKEEGFSRPSADYAIMMDGEIQRHQDWKKEDMVSFVLNQLEEHNAH